MSDGPSVERYIQKLIDWQDKTGKKCRDPFATIKSWIEQDVQRNQADESSYDLDEFEQYALNFSLSQKKGVGK